MQLTGPLNLFYEEPQADRWFKYDRYLRKIVRRLVRGKQRPGGVMTIAINLMKGFDKLGIPYRYNDYRYIKKHPDEIACIIGKPHVLFEKNWPNPVIFGAGIYSHPVDYPTLFKDYPNVKRFLVPGDWMRDMCEPYYGNKVLAWPVGVDTEQWSPTGRDKPYDFLIYDKVRWEHPHYEEQLIGPIIKHIKHHRLTFQIIRYGSYKHDELKEKLSASKAVIFLCEHETQGLAYQQILAANIPILAWDRGGYWQDPSYYPKKVKYQAVSSVPYWDDRCGVKFTDATDFSEKLELFLSKRDGFKPRDYIMENLTLEICSKKYLDIYHQVEKEIDNITAGKT